MRATSGLRRQIPADAAASQLGEPNSPAFPLLPGDGTQPSPGPLVEVAQHRRSLAEVEVAAPPSEVDRQLLDDLREALASRTTRQFPHSASEPGQRLRLGRPKAARHPDGARPLHSAGNAAGAAGGLGPDVLRAQLRLPTEALGASGGDAGARDDSG